MKEILKGRRFTSIDDIKSAWLNGHGYPKDRVCEVETLDWQKRWHKCIVSNGDYFEVDNINVDE
jgi:hypothetical protein